MELLTKRFGTIEVPDENALEVPAGIPGFPQMRRATLMGANAVVAATARADGSGTAGSDSGGGDAAALADELPLFWLQDLDDGNLAFLCLVPWGSFPEYDFDIDGDELGVEDEADVRILNIITVRRSAQEVQMTANLRAPLVVDVRNQRLHQVILTDHRWSINAPIEALESAEVR